MIAIPLADADAVAAPPPPPPPPPPPVEDFQPLDDDLDFNAPAPKKAAPAKRRDDDSDDDLPARKPKPAGKRPRDDDYNPDDFAPGDDPDNPRLHPGWKSVALGYHLLGFAALVAGLALVAGMGIFVALGGIQKGQTLLEAQNAPAFDKSESVRTATDTAAKDLTGVILISALAGGGLMSVASLLLLIGHVLFILMPKDEDGGKGKTLGIIQFVTLLVGVLPANIILLPLYTMGIGTQLNKPKVKKAGLGLLVWLILAPGLLAGASFGGFFGMVKLAPPAERKDVPQAATFALIVSSGLTFGAAVISLLGIGGCTTAARRGILASVRERGVIGGPGPQPKQEKEKDTGKGKKKKGDDDDDDDDDRPKKGKAKRDDDSSADHRPLKAKAKREDDEDDAPPPKKKRRDDDDDDDRPRKKR